MSKLLRVLIVDDSVVCRTFVREALANNPHVRVVGVAPDGEAALAAIDVLKPDLITLDIEMPKTDGIGVLRELKKRRFGGAVVVVSKLTIAGAQLTHDALELGAFDFVVKPTGGDYEHNIDILRDELGAKIEAYIRDQRETERVPTPTAPLRPIVGGRKPEIVVVGVSTGGPIALGTVLPALPVDFSVPIVVVQH
ncbi:MAG: response regulator, partial [Planctomycetales bacterium]|nr:response regulator [Planctomycetales bacterium]